MRVLVTGAEGFVGTHLRERLAAAGHEVVATSVDGSVGSRLQLPDDAGAAALVAREHPDVIFHLAAVAFVPDATADPGLAHRVNVDGTCSLFRAAQTRPGTRFVYISSSAVYGIVPAAEQPLTESTGTAPADVYGWTKLGAECALHSLGDDVSLTIVRPFNHTGPGQDSRYVLSGFARQVAEVERGAQPVVKVGNLQVRRDFLDVRDVVDAYLAVAESTDLHGTYNLCSGTAYLLADLLERLCRESQRDIDIEVDSDRFRPADLELLQGDPTRLQNVIDWSPRYSIDETLGDLISDWRTRLAAEVPK